MPYDAFGNFTRSYNFTADKLALIKIQSARVDGECDNFSTAFNQVMLRNGVAPMTGALKMGGNNVTSIAAGSAVTPAVSFAGDVTTGMFQPAAGIIGFAAVGAEVMRLTATGGKVTGTLEVTGATTLDGALTVAGATTINGALTINVQPVYAANVGAAEPLLASGTLGVASAALDIALPAGYLCYKVILLSADPVTNAGVLTMRVSTDNGATYVTAANTYGYAGMATDDSGAYAHWESAGNTALIIQPATVGATNVVGYNPSIIMEIFQTGINNTTFLWRGWRNAATTFVKSMFSGGGSTVATGITNVRFQFSAGNVAAGAKWAVHGVRGI